MEKYKEEYEKLLERYKNGCSFLSTLNPKDEKYDFYLNKLLEILEKINEIVSKYPNLVENI